MSLAPFPLLPPPRRLRKLKRSALYGLEVVAASVALWSVIRFCAHLMTYLPGGAFLLFPLLLFLGITALVYVFGAEG